MSTITQVRVIDKPPLGNAFPKLMKNADGLIVLFVSPVRGTVVHCVKPTDDLGSYSERWDSRAFTDFYGHLTFISEKP